MPVLIFLTGKFHEERSLEGYRPRGPKESDMTEHKHYRNQKMRPWLRWLSIKKERRMYLRMQPTGTLALKKEFIGPGLHLRPVRADRAGPLLQWALNSLLSACGNHNGRIRPPPDRGTLKIISRLLIA